MTLISAAGVLVLAAVPVQITGVGIDLYGLLFAGVLLLVVERTAGDWVANALGPVGTALAFAVVAAAGVAYLLSDGGRKRVERVMVVAEAHGYRPVYFKTRHDPEHEREEDVEQSVAHVADAPAPSPDAAPSSAALPPRETAASQSTPATAESGFRLFPWSGDREQATARLLAPELAQPGEDVLVRFKVVGQPKQMPAEVSFYVNGQFLAREAVQADGTAATHWHPRLPGQYQLRAETSTSSLESRVFSGIVDVLPGKR